jgi:phosphomannomutase
MTLIKSISGIRGTIGGNPGDGLTPLDIVKFTSAFATFIQESKPGKRLKFIVGRDARLSGEMVNSIVCGTLSGMGADVIDLGLSTTPTVEVAVPAEDADAGIILTASHNPKQWNALKLLNDKGEFISGEEGKKVLEYAENDSFTYAEIDDIGTISYDDTYIDKHIKAILDLPLVDVDLIREANFEVAVDCVNSTGGISLPPLLKALGVKKVHELYCEPTGEFPHNPEPLPAHLTELSELMRSSGAHVGFTVDPDVDRLAIICEDGEMFGEEYTLVAVADYILKNNPGNTVSNLSSTRALRDVTAKYNKEYNASAVGEVNVVKMMKDTDAVIGGEGNGGIIYPELHYGRDSLVGIALFLTHLAQMKMPVSELRASYPNYFISKNKMELSAGMDVDKILASIAEMYKNEEVSTVDGVKIDFAEGWVHLRKSNTEPIIRIYSESDSEDNANSLSLKIIDNIKELM